MRNKDVTLTPRVTTRIMPVKECAEKVSHALMSNGTGLESVANAMTQGICAQLMQKLAVLLKTDMQANLNDELYRSILTTRGAEVMEAVAAAMVSETNIAVETGVKAYHNEMLRLYEDTVKSETQEMQTALERLKSQTLQLVPGKTLEPVDTKAAVTMVNDELDENSTTRMPTKRQVPTWNWERK